MASDLRDGFVRQRRNLIISSLVLTFAQASGLTITKLNIFGNEFDLAHPYSVITALWIATWYWAIRYYQYFTELKPLGIKSTYLEKFQSYIPSIALNKLKEKHPHLLSPPADAPNASVRIELMDYVCYERRENYERATLATIVTVQAKDFESVQEIGPIEIITMTKHLYKQKALSIFHVFFNTTKFTEYILPFLIFLLALLYGLRIILAN